MLKDDDLMPWGDHKGKIMSEVPDRYLLWLYTANKCYGDVKEYIVDNMDVIKLNVKNQSTKKESTDI